MEKNEELNRRIDETIATWQPPFSDHSAERAKAKVMARTELKPAAKLVQIRARITVLQAAAVIAVLIGLPFLIWFAGNAEVVNTQTSQMRLELPDGSRATLAPNATLRYNTLLWEVHRSTDLSGAAFFEVEPGSNFSVKSSVGEVQVKGTVFSVWAAQSRMLVHCLSGKVAVRSAGATRELNSGSLARVIRGRADIEVSDHVSALPAMPGSNRELEFDHAPLPLVCAELEQIFGVKITSDLPRSLRFTGVLRPDSKEESLRILCKTFGATYVEEGKSITLKP